MVFWWFAGRFWLGVDVVRWFICCGLLRSFLVVCHSMRSGLTVLVCVAIVGLSWFGRWCFVGLLVWCFGWLRWCAWVPWFCAVWLLVSFLIRKCVLGWVDLVTAGPSWWLWCRCAFLWVWGGFGCAEWFSGGWVGGLAIRVCCGVGIIYSLHWWFGLFWGCRFSWWVLGVWVL